MMRPLRVLKLAIPGNLTTKWDYSANGVSAAKHKWPCGCIAHGPDEDVVELVACPHHDKLFGDIDLRIDRFS